MSLSFRSSHRRAPQSSANFGMGTLVRAPDLLQPLIAAAIPPVEFIFRRVLQIEILVIVLGRVERAGGDDLRIDRLLELGPDFFLGGFREFALLVVAHENRGAVLVAAVAELPVFHGRIDGVPVIGEQFLVGDLARVIDHLHRLGVPSAAGRDLFVARIGDIAAGVARRGRDHPRHMVEIRFRAPEAAAGEDRHRLAGTRLRQRRHLRDRQSGGRKYKDKAKQQAAHSILPKSITSGHDIYALRIIAIQLAITPASRLCEPQIALLAAHALPSVALKTEEIPCVLKAPRPMWRPTISRSRSTPRSRWSGPCWSRASPAPARPCWRWRSRKASARR